MPDQPTKYDARLRSVLTELSMGRLTVDEAYAQIDDLDKPSTRGKPQKQSIGAGVLILLFGAIFAGVGGYFASKSLSFSHDSARTEGTVVRHERSGDKGSRVPIIQYTVDGNTHEVRGDISSGSPPSLKSKLNILYKTADPSQAQIDSFVQRWLFPLIFGGIGGLVTLVGLIVVVQGIVQKLRSAISPAADGAAERFNV
jgi:hypothetical protein